MSDESTSPSTEPVMHLMGAGGVAIEPLVLIDAILANAAKTKEVN